MNQVSGVLWQIYNTKTKEIYLSGIVPEAESNIYPAQEEPYLLGQFPNLPYECELHKFKCKGLDITTKDFVIAVKDLLSLIN